MNEKMEKRPIHPGAYIKNAVFPKKLTIKAAAELLGVGRPALSNLINGNASLSPEMAVRVEKTFGVSRRKLMELQTQYDDFEIGQRESEISVRGHGANFLQIRARHIQTWSDQIYARQQLSALLRRLVNTTCKKLTLVDFPAYDHSERPGWDGLVESNEATPWVPKGKSGWEFGVSKNPSSKANKDYRQRVKKITTAQRKEMTFVFVTPRNWPEKNDWVKAKTATGDWKNVRAFDANDLEQWLEQSVPTQCWFGETLGMRDTNILSLDESWLQWASVTEPELSKELFKLTTTVHVDALKNWLHNQPSKPFVVAADSAEEAVAFLVCAFENIGESEPEHYDNAVVVASADALQKVTVGQANFILIIDSGDAEKALAGVQKKQHTIIVRHKNDVHVKPDISVESPNYETFKQALLSMGINEQEVDRCSRESGKSLTILRRRLSTVPEIRAPQWSKDDRIANELLPLALVGVWNADATADQEILKLMSDKSYEVVEKRIADISQLKDPPIWSHGSFRGVISKIDALYAVRKTITRKDIDNFFFVAELVLTEEDPALELAPDKRWAAAIYEKTRNHSGAIRTALCETLVLLSVHGRDLVGDRLGINVDSMVKKLVRRLLVPFNPNTWLSQGDDLPRYAEASPEVFLELVEEDLGSGQPEILALLAPAESGFIMGGCPRSGLLWALELLAWKAERLPRVVAILAKLSAQEIDDNWMNKPINSLQAIFRYWMPQTAADLEQRETMLKMIAEKFPNIGWQICVSQFNPGMQHGEYSHRPRWRNDATAAAILPSIKEQLHFCRTAIELALKWPSHDESTLGDLITRLQGMPSEYETQIWRLIADWSAGKVTDEQKATLREVIRQFALTRIGSRRNLDKNTKIDARKIYEILTPGDCVTRHLWLFAEGWVEHSATELEDEDTNFEKREERISRERAGALQEIWRKQNISGIERLLSRGNAAWTIGFLLARDVLEDSKSLEVLAEIVSNRDESIEAKVNDCISGFLNAYTVTERTIIMKQLATRFRHEDDADENLMRLLKCAPFRNKTWKQVENLSPELRNRYWCEVCPRWDRQDSSELKELIERLLEVNRPRAALCVAHLRWSEIESAQIVELLREVAVSRSEPVNTYHFSSHHVTSALTVLEQSLEVSQDDLARLEFMFIKILEHSKHGIPNLAKELSESPQLFVEALTIVFRRDDGSKDPVETNELSVGDREALISPFHGFLQSAKRIPGTRDDMTINVDDLFRWISEVRTNSKKCGREKVGDRAIGRLVSNSPVGNDGLWPCESVRKVLEDIASREIGVGLQMGISNSRGATWRGDDGEPELSLAQKYRKWSQEMAFTFPYMSNELEQIARGFENDAERNIIETSVQERIGY